MDTFLYSYCRTSLVFLLFLWPVTFVLGFLRQTVLLPIGNAI